jgi:hypothetical protein
MTDQELLISPIRKAGQIIGKYIEPGPRESAALGQEFREVLSPPVPSDLIVPQDGFEVWRRAFGTDPNPAALAELTDADIKRLLAVCIAYFECPSLSETHVRLAASPTLARWPI